MIIQEIPREEAEADDSDKVIGVFHFSKELVRTHGVPFKFVVKRVRCLFSDSRNDTGLTLYSYPRARNSRRPRSDFKLG